MKFKYQSITLISVLLSVATNVVAQSGNDTEISVNIENERVQKFFHKETYTGFVSRNYDFNSYSKAYKYYKDKAELETPIDIPQPAVVKVGDCYGLATKLICTDTENAKDSQTIAVAADADEVEIWNLVPQRTYEYTFVDENDEPLSQGKIHTEGQLRMLRFEGLRNVRDIGGWNTTDGRQLKYNKILRGSELGRGHKIESLLSNDSLELLRLGIGGELDMRRTADIIGEQIMENSSINDNIPFLATPMKDDTNMILDYKDELRQAFEFIIDNLRHDRITYIHCTYGADRTGMLVALIESLCGVTLDNIYKDYELSAFSPLVGNRYYYVINQRIVRKLNIQQPVDYHAAVRKYLNLDLGISNEDLDDMRELLIESNDDINAIESVSDQRENAAVSTYNTLGLRVQNNYHGIMIRKDQRGTRKVLWMF